MPPCTRAGLWDDPEDSPHEARPTSCLSKAIMGISLKCQSLEWKAVFLGSCYWGYTPYGPGFGDKEPVTHGIIFKVLPHYLNQQHKHEMTWSQVFSFNKSNACRPSKQLFLRTAVQIFKIFNQNEEEILQESLANLYSQLWFKGLWSEGNFYKKVLRVCTICKDKIPIVAQTG